MLAAWYDRQGPAAEVLRVGELPAPSRAPARCGCGYAVGGEPWRHEEARRLARLGHALPARRPAQRRLRGHRAVGEGVDAARIGQRVWVYGAQSYRPFGTAAQLTVVPAEQAVELPDQVSDEVGACLGIPGITAHRAVFADGPVTARSSSCTACSAASARSPRSSPAGAARTVIGTVAARRDLDASTASPYPHAVALDEPDPAGAIRAHAPAASTASSRSPSRTTPTWTPPSPQRGGHRRLRHAQPTAPFPSGRCCSPTHDPAARQRRLPARGETAGRAT